MGHRKRCAGELDYLIAMTDRKAVIKNADMSEDMQQDAIDCATQSLEKYNIEKDIAAFIKKEVRQKIQPNLALYCWPQLWLVRDARDKALHLLLLGTGTFSRQPCGNS